MSKFNLTEAENDVMDFFWTNEGKFAFGEIYDYIINEKKKTWKKQTLQTYITHLIQKDILANEKKGNMYLYFLKTPKGKYMQKWTKEFLDNTFDGSVKNFLSALSGGNSLDEKTINELKEFLNDDEG